MRYELSDHEWTAIKPMLPNKPRGVRRVNDRRVLNGIFWVLRSGAPWRDLPENYGPRTTCYNRFVRWRRAGVWDHIMDALAAGHDAAVVRLPGPDGRDMAWFSSARMAAEDAMKNWSRVTSNMSLGAYVPSSRIISAEPNWPELSFGELISIAFRYRLIMGLSHPVVKRLWGLA